MVRWEKNAEAKLDCLHSAILLPVKPCDTPCLFLSQWSNMMLLSDEHPLQHCIFLLCENNAESSIILYSCYEHTTIESIHILHETTKNSLTSKIEANVNWSTQLMCCWHGVVGGEGGCFQYKDSISSSTEHRKGLTLQIFGLCKPWLWKVNK